MRKPLLLNELWQKKRSVYRYIRDSCANVDLKGSVAHAHVREEGKAGFPIFKPCTYLLQRLCEKQCKESLQRTHTINHQSLDRLDC